MHYRSTPKPTSNPHLLRFVRHGATAVNLAGLRCGGDIDPPLTDTGRQQAAHTAAALLQRAPAPGLIVTSDLRRTRETATILAAALGGLPVQVLPAWAERHLGIWNLQPIADTQDALLAGHTPPGGESVTAFHQRIHQAVQSLLPLLQQRPLLVGSKGVARVLGQLCGLPTPLALDNGALWHFDLAALVRRAPAGAGPVSTNPVCTNPVCTNPVWETT